MTSITNSIFKTADGDAFLILGDIEFGHMEVPDKFNFGGDQMMTVQQLVGGQRIINTLGSSEHDITWSGFFYGGTATERALALDYLRKKGNTIELIFGTFVYKVIIKTFSPEFQRFYQIPYSITLQVVKNDSLPIPFAVPTGYNDAVNADARYVTTLAAIIDRPSLTASVENLNKSIADAGNLADASQDSLNLIKENIAETKLVNIVLLDISEP